MGLGEVDGRPPSLLSWLASVCPLDASGVVAPLCIRFPHAMHPKHHILSVSYLKRYFLFKKEEGNPIHPFPSPLQTKAGGGASQGVPPAPFRCRSHPWVGRPEARGDRAQGSLDVSGRRSPRLPALSRIKAFPSHPEGVLPRRPLAASLDPPRPLRSVPPPVVLACPLFSASSSRRPASLLGASAPGASRTFTHPVPLRPLRNQRPSRPIVPATRPPSSGDARDQKGERGGWRHLPAPPGDSQPSPLEGGERRVRGGRDGKPLRGATSSPVRRLVSGA